MQSTLKPEKLITKEFLALNAIVFLTYCNIAVFFEFHHYLGTLPIDEMVRPVDRALFRDSPCDQADYQPASSSGQCKTMDRHQLLMGDRVPAALQCGS